MRETRNILLSFILLIMLLFTYTNNLYSTDSAHADKSTHETSIEHEEENITDEHADSAKGHDVHVNTEHSASGAVIKNQVDKHGSGNKSHGDKGGHGGDDSHGGGHGIHEAPIEYYMIWSLIIFIIVMLFGYYMKFITTKGLFGSRVADDDLEHQHDIETTGFAMMVILLGFVFFGIQHTPELFGYFDPKTHTFADGYHESQFSGTLRFFVVMSTGALMTAYAFLGMKHNNNGNK